MSESKTKRALLRKLNLQPHPASALPHRSLTIGYSFSRLKRENAELLLLDNSSSSRTFIKPTPLLFKIFEQVVAWLPPSFRGLLTPALTQQNKAETFAQHTISPLPCSPCTKCPLMKGRQTEAWASEQIILFNLGIESKHSQVSFDASWPESKLADPWLIMFTRCSSKEGFPI